MAAAITVRTDRGEEPLELEEFEARVARGEIAPQCPARFPPVTGDTWVPAGSLEVFRQRYSPRELHFTRSFRLGGLPRVTLGFTLLAIGWYIAMQTWPVGSSDDTLIAYGAKAGPLLLDLGQFWRLLTANMVHRDVLHIGMNLFVLFNFAGALENAFRPLDMLLILLSSALGTTALSAIVTDPISAGASGVAYGALGGAVVFGLKYRALLPERYRRVLGGAVVPTVLVFLFLGFTSSGVDNWGHLGGLIAGSITTWFLKPRMLSDMPSARRLWLTRGLPIGATIALLLLAGPLSRGFLPIMAPHVDSRIGLAVPIPTDWEAGASQMGSRTYFNGLSGFGEARVSVGGYLSDKPTSPADPDSTELQSALDELIQKELWEPETNERLRVNWLGPVQDVTLASGALQGLRRRGVFRREGIDFDFLALVLHRGRLVYLLDAISCQSQPAYKRLLERMTDAARPTEPRFLGQARALRLFLPSSEEAKAGLQDALLAVGESPGE